MRTPGELWEALGDIDGEETGHVLSRIFVFYEQLLQQDSRDKEALNFFRHLDNALSQTTQCNLNRR